MLKTANLELRRASIVELLRTNDRAIGRALIVLNNNQTADEQIDENTKHHNGKGFRPVHAQRGTSMAKFFTERGFLTPKQIAYWRKPNSKGEMRIAIYWRQLIAAADAKAAALVAKTEDTSFAFGHNAA